MGDLRNMNRSGDGKIEGRGLGRWQALERKEIEGRGLGRWQALERKEIEGRGLGRWQALERKERGRDNIHTSFQVSHDGINFHYRAPPNRIGGNAPLLDGFRNSLRLLGSYSEDKDGKFVGNRTYLPFLDTRYLLDKIHREKKVNLDLTVAESEGLDFSGCPENSFSNFLKWIVNNSNTFRSFKSSAKEREAPSKKNGGKFLLMKSCLSELITTPYMLMTDFNIYATCIDGIVYLLKEKPSNNSRISLWAHKFEQYMTGGTAGDGVICNQNCRCILTAKVGSHNLLYSAHVDCANPDLYNENSEDLSAFLSLKCSKAPLNEKEHLKLVRLKMIYWYVGCLLTGVPQVIVGYRDTNGRVQHLQLYDTNDMLIRGKNHWDPSISLRFLDEFLSFVKDRTETHPGITFLFAKESGKTTITSEIDETFGPILPEWFLSEASKDFED